MGKDEIDYLFKDVLFDLINTHGWDYTLTEI